MGSLAACIMGPAGAPKRSAGAGHEDATWEQMLGIPCRPESWAARGAPSSRLLSLPLGAALRGSRGGR